MGIKMESGLILANFLRKVSVLNTLHSKTIFGLGGCRPKISDFGKTRT